MSEAPVGRTLKTATAVLRVLRQLALGEEGLSSEQVAKGIGKSLATATYLLNSLVAEGFAVREAGRYWLIEPISLRQPSTARNTTHELAAAAEELYGRTRERTYVGLPDQDSLIIHDTWGRQGQALVTGLDPKIEGTAHALAVGKAVLAHMGPDRVAAYLDRYGLTSFTPATITDACRLEDELASVVNDGVAVDDEEFVEGFACLAAPVFDAEGLVRGAVAVSVSHAKFAHHGDRLAPILKQIAERASGQSTELLDQSDDIDLTNTMTRLHAV